MFFQVGTDVDYYRNVEEGPDDDETAWKPLFPFLLWLTNDKRQGDLFMRADHKSFFLGSVGLNPTAVNIFVRAFDLLYKSHYVFNLDHHMYLSSYYNFIDSLYGMKVSLSTTVKQLSSAIKGHKKKK